MDSTVITDKRTTTTRQLSEEEESGAPHSKKRAFGHYTCSICMDSVANKLYVCRNTLCLTGTCHTCLKNQKMEYKNRCSSCSFVIPLSLRCQLVDCHFIREIEVKGLLTECEKEMLTNLETQQFFAGINEKDMDMTSDESSALYLIRLLNSLNTSRESYYIAEYLLLKLIESGVNPECKVNMSVVGTKGRFKTLVEEYSRYGEGEIAFSKMKLLITAAQNNPDNFVHSSPLINAIKHKNMKLTELLLEHQASCELSDDQGLFPIHYASTPSMANIILAHGSDKDQVDKLSTDGLTPLLYHCQQGNFIMASYWLDKGANIERTTNAGENVFSLIFSNLQGMKKNLSYAAARFVSRLLENDFSRDSLKKLLILCAESDYLNRSVMTTTIIEGLKKKDQLGLVLDSGALACAVANKDFQLAQLLVNEGFDPQAAYNGKTAVDYAVDHQKDVFITLLNHETEDNPQGQAVSDQVT